MELWEMLARESIRDLITRYNSYGDSGLFDRMIELFAVEAVLEVGGEIYRGRDEIRGMFASVPDASSRGGTQRPAYLRHCTATHQIDLIDERTATGRCYFFVLSKAGLDHWGRYLDDYRALDGEWKFVRRRVLPDAISEQSVFQT